MCPFESTRLRAESLPVRAKAFAHSSPFPLAIPPQFHGHSSDRGRLRDADEIAYSIQKLDQEIQSLTISYRDREYLSLLLPYLTYPTSPYPILPKHTPTKRLPGGYQVRLCATLCSSNARNYLDYPSHRPSYPPPSSEEIEKIK